MKTKTNIHERDINPIHSIHFSREKARKEERRVQEMIDKSVEAGASSFSDIDAFADIDAQGIPRWARGVKVVNAGQVQHAVIYTVNRGH